MIIDLTIIAPVYNEQESLERFKEEMDKFLDQSQFKACVLFVDDGSKDSSLEIIRSICKSDSRYNFISLRKNHGLSTAIKAGIDQVETLLTGYIDTDLQTTPMDFEKYFPYVDSYEMVTGIRSKRHDGFVKKVSSKIANKIRRQIINDGIVDTCCPLKIIHTEYANKIPFFKGMHRFIPTLIQLHGGKVKQVNIQHFERYAGTAKYHLFNRIFGAFFDTLAVVWMRKRIIKYKSN